MSETSLNTFESRPELLNACMPRRPTDTHDGTPLHVEVPEIAVQSSFSPDLLTDTGLAVSQPALSLPVNHSLEGVSVQSPPSCSSASSLALLSHPAPSCGATLEIQHPEGSVSARPLVGGLASRLGSPAVASGEPLLGPQQDPTACRHSLPLPTSGSTPRPSPIDLGLPNRSLLDRYAVGCFLMAVYSCARLGDLKVVSDFRLDLDGDSDVGYLELYSLSHKARAYGNAMGLRMPMVAPVKGIGPGCWGRPPLRFLLGPPFQVTLILILPCFRGLCCSVPGYPPEAFCVVLPLAFSWIFFLVLKNL